MTRNPLHEDPEAVMGRTLRGVLVERNVNDVIVEMGERGRPRIPMHLVGAVKLASRLSADEHRALDEEDKMWTQDVEFFDDPNDTEEEEEEEALLNTPVSSRACARERAPSARAAAAGASDKRALAPPCPRGAV